MSKLPIIAVLLTVAVTTGSVVFATQSGALNFFGIGKIDNSPIINGTIVNQDNKTYGILIVPSKDNVTVPPQCLPNQHVHDGMCMDNPPPKPINKPPVITVQTPINCTIGQNCLMIATADDSDGNVTQVIWNIETDQNVELVKLVDHTTTPDTYTATFVPKLNGSYTFSVEAQDNNGSAVLKSITAKVGTIPTPVPVPPPKPTCTADQVYNPNTNKCDPKPVPTPVPVPTPTPTPTAVTVVVVGDVENSGDGTAVFNSIKAKKPNVVIGLGDLGYSSSLSWYLSTYGKLNSLCVPGNHESSNEDGTAALQTETAKVCSLPWYFKVNNVLFIGVNTNGNLDVQLGQAQGIVMDPKQMQGIKEVHLVTHKPCATPPNAHHPVESKVKTLCDSLKAKVPSGVKFINDAGHNHVLSVSSDGTYKTSGAGGRSHYSCGVSTAFPFCDSSHFGYIEYTIQPNGTTSYKVLDYNGKVLLQK